MAVTPSPAATEAMHRVVEHDAATPCLIIPTVVGGYNVYWKVADGEVRVLVRPDGTLDLHFKRPALPDLSVQQSGVRAGEIGGYL